MSSCDVPGCQLEFARDISYEQKDKVLTRHLMTHIVEELSGINWYLMHLAAGQPLPLPDGVTDEGGAAWDTGSATSSPEQHSTPQEPTKSKRPPGTIIKRAEPTDE